MLNDDVAVTAAAAGRSPSVRSDVVSHGKLSVAKLHKISEDQGQTDRVTTSTRAVLWSRPRHAARLSALARSRSRDGNKAKTAVSVAVEAKPEVEICRQPPPPQKSTF